MLPVAASDSFYVCFLRVCSLLAVDDYWRGLSAFAAVEIALIPMHRLALLTG